MLRVAVIGDFRPGNETHIAIEQSLVHTGVVCQVEWIATPEVTERSVAGSDGIWCAPGSPFASLQGALDGIRTARENGVPFLGTCAGFQHAVIEFARDVLGIGGAASEEYDPLANELFVSRLSCSLVGTEMTVHAVPGSRVHEAYGADTAVEKYYCNFGLNPACEPALEAAGLRITARDRIGEARALELPHHPFFVGTLFVPQTTSAQAAPHPIISAFVRAAAERAMRSGGA